MFRTRKNVTNAAATSILLVLVALGTLSVMRPGSGLTADHDLSERLVVPLVGRDAANATQTPTPPAPTAVPSPTSTPAPTGVYIRDNFSSYISSIGSLWIVGEVVNGLNHPISFVEIDVSLFSSNGTLLDTDFTFADVGTIPSGGDSPFALLVFDPQPGITSFELFVESWDDTPFSPPVGGLEATVTNSFFSIIGTLHDVGTVTNNSATTYEFVEVIIAYYDAEGTVIRVDFTFGSPNTLAPGKTGTFEVLVLDGQDLPIVSRKIWVEANFP